MKKTILRIGLVVLLAMVAVAAGFWLWLTATPQPRDFPVPPLSQWIPQGVREAGPAPSKVLPAPDAFHTMHVNSVNSDELWTAIAPTFAADWVAETGFYIAEGPTFDNTGCLHCQWSGPRRCKNRSLPPSRPQRWGRWRSTTRRC